MAPRLPKVFVLKWSMIDQLHAIGPSTMMYLALFVQYGDVSAVAEADQCTPSNVHQRLRKIGTFIPDGSQWIWRDRPKRNRPTRNVGKGTDHDR